MKYEEFLADRRHITGADGFKPVFQLEALYDFQRELVEWALGIGRAAIFADCGLGKTPIQLAWAQNVVEHTNRPVLISAPLAVSAQTVREAKKFGIPITRSQDGRVTGRAEIVVTNYERLEHFDRDMFAGVVCDESSILKHYDGVTRARVTEFMRPLAYRLLCTATAAPNDYIEFGTSSEALGYLGYMDMLSRFFKNDESSIAPMSYASKWRFKPHAKVWFWRWMCSWARAMRRPSDLGYADDRFMLPVLKERVTVVHCTKPLPGMLFVMPARDLHEQRHERRATLQARCEKVAQIAQSHDRPYLCWCHLNDEGDTLERLLPDAVQVSGADSDEVKEERFEAFVLGRVRGMITKAKIGGFGLNWEHCSDMTFFPSHSWEQCYQGVRRCWRYGQKRPVEVDVITTDGEADVIGNLKRKAVAAERAFEEMIGAVREASDVRSIEASPFDAPLPAWMEDEHVA